MEPVPNTASAHSEQNASQRADKLFGPWALGALHKFREITDCYDCFAEGVKAGVQKSYQEYDGYYMELVGKVGHVLPGVPVGTVGEYVLTEEDCRRAAGDKARAYGFWAKSIMDAGLTVFAHSVFESLVHDGFRIDFEANKLHWEAKLVRRAVTFKTALEGPEAVWAEGWSKEWHEITRETTLSKNVNRLLGICCARNRPEYERTRIQFRCDESRVVEIDKLRQRLVHRPFEVIVVPDVAETVAVLRSITLTIAYSVARCILGHTDVEISPMGGVIRIGRP